MGAVKVVGVVGDAAPTSDVTRKAIAEAGLVVGGRRHLDAFDVPAERRLVLGPVDPAVAALQQRGGTPAVVLASGDPGFFGIVRRLRAAGIDLDVEPAPSACALAFGRLGLAREDAQIVSAHGRDLRPALNVVRAHDLVAVMTTVGAGLREIAAGCWAWPRRFALLEDLGGPRERVRWFTRDEALALDPADVVEPNVVVTVADEDDPRYIETFTGPGMPWRAGGRGEHRDASAVRTDVLAALVIGAFGTGPGDLVATAGEGLQIVAAAAEERGAAVVRLDAVDRPTVVDTPHGDLSAWREPDALCVAVTRGVLPDVEILPGTRHTPLRHLAFVTDDLGLFRAEAALRLLAPDFDRRHLGVPTAAPLGRREGQASGLHLLLASRSMS